MKDACDQITVAVTAYDRREYIEQAVASAMAQNPPVRVIVVEDCGPDPSLQSLVTARFGSQVQYFRNPRRRGLFDNWNACLELCQTPWLCILHDDDFLEPCYTETMLGLLGRFPNRGFYFGAYHQVDARGAAVRSCFTEAPEKGVEANLVAAAVLNQVGFPAQLIHAESARKLGGFRPTSLYTGDWEMWFKLMAHYGGVRTGRVIANVREHFVKRATPAIDAKGKRYPLTTVQQKRNFALLRALGKEVRFDRAAALAEAPLPIRYLLCYARHYPRRRLVYHWELLMRSRHPTAASRMGRRLFQWLGPRGTRWASSVCGVFGARV